MSPDCPSLQQPAHPPPAWFAGDGARLARAQFFEQGRLPSGLLPAPVLRSWQRCAAAGLAPEQPLALAVAGASRLHAAEARHAALLAAADRVLPTQPALVQAGAVLVLASPDGLVLRSLPAALPRRQPASLLRLATRRGARLDERRSGTQALALVARGEPACSVNGAAHYLQAWARWHSAAAPVPAPLQPQGAGLAGGMAGVLALVAEEPGFGFDPLALAGLLAAQIGQQMALASPGAAVLLRLHPQAALLDSSEAALVGLSHQGRPAWANLQAGHWLGRLSATTDVAARLGWPLAQLQALARRGGVAALCLPSGLAVWLQAEPAHPASAPPAAPPRPARPALAAAAAAAPLAPKAKLARQATPAPLALHAARQQALEQALAASGGNLAAAARLLGVSRGWVYRQLRATAPRPTEPAAPGPASPA